MSRVLFVAAVLVLTAQAAGAQSNRFYLRGDLGLVLGTPAVETDTDPGSAMEPPSFEKVERTSALVRLRLSESAST